MPHCAAARRTPSRRICHTDPVRMLPETSSSDTKVIFFARAVRAFVDGTAFVIFPVFLVGLGFSGFEVGSIVTASMLGSAVLTLTVGVVSHRIQTVTLLSIGSLIMFTTGVAFGFATNFWVLVCLGLITTMNTSAGDVSPFLPMEQALLSESVDDAHRTAAFARFNLVGSLVGSIGALLAGVPIAIALWLGFTEQAGRHAAFIVYGLAGLVLFQAYRQLGPAARRRSAGARPSLEERSRRTVMRLAALFSLDSFGGGFATQSIFAVWVLHRFGLSAASLGAIFAATGILSAFSSLLSVRVARHIGMVRTMVYTHIPASVLLILVALAPNEWIAMSLFVLRGLLSQMDVPVRTSYVMAVVSPRERVAAASITNIPRSLASAAPPAVAGWMLDQSVFGWPLIICACLKITYDMLLLMMFRDVRPPEERAFSD